MTRMANVGHYPTNQQADTIGLMQNLDGICWMNYAQPYSNDNHDLAPAVTGKRYNGEAWDQWPGVPFANILDDAKQAGAGVNYFSLPYALDYWALERAGDLLDAFGPAATYVGLGREAWNDGGKYMQQNRYLRSVAGGRDYWDSVTGNARRLKMAANAMGRPMVLEGQCTGVEFARRSLEAESVRESVNALAIAPYIGRPHFITAWLQKHNKAATIENIYQAVIEDFETEIKPGILAHAELAKKFDLPLIWYEFGHHLLGGTFAMRRLAQMDKLVDAVCQLDEFGRNLGIDHRFYYRLWHAYDGGQHWRAYEVNGATITPTPLARVLERNK